MIENNELAQLSESRIESLGKDIASLSLPKALALLNGIARAFLEQEFPNNRCVSMRHSHAHGISMAVNVRLFECISLIRSVVAGRVDRDHKLTHEEQAVAGEPKDHGSLSGEQRS